MRYSKPWKRRIAAATTAVLLGLALPAGAESVPDAGPTGEMMFFDVAFLRPFGLAATALGSAAFVVSLPFSWIGGNLQDAAQKLVVDPFLYTFDRPLGEPERPQ
jgi:hypothetical protein